MAAMRSPAPSLPGALEPDGEHGFVGGAVEAFLVALQGVARGGQLAIHVVGIAVGIGLGAFGGEADEGGGLVAGRWGRA